MKDPARSWHAVDRLFRADLDPGTPVTVGELRLLLDHGADPEATCDTYQRERHGDRRGPLPRPRRYRGAPAIDLTRR